MNPLEAIRRRWWRRERRAELQATIALLWSRGDHAVADELLAEWKALGGKGKFRKG